jgi:hypothetical protein
MSATPPQPDPSTRYSQTGGIEQEAKQRTGLKSHMLVPIVRKLREVEVDLIENHTTGDVTRELGSDPCSMGCVAARKTESRTPASTWLDVSVLYQP